MPDPAAHTGSSLKYWIKKLSEPCDCGHPFADHLMEIPGGANKGDIVRYPCTGGDGYFCGCN